MHNLSTGTPRSPSVDHVVSRHTITRTLSDNFIRILWAASVYGDHQRVCPVYNEFCISIMTSFTNINLFDR